MDPLKSSATRFCLPVLLATLAPPVGAGVVGGVVVEEAARGFAAHAAGLQPGDVIVSWSREANPPANPLPAHGEIGTPFDLVEVEIEQAPRGRLTLSGRRGDAPASWVCPDDEWRLRTRPVLPPRIAALYDEGRRLIETRRVAEGAERWRAAANVAKGTEPPWLAAWFSFRTAEALDESGDHAQADRLYADAEQFLTDPAVLSARAQVFRKWGLSLRSRSRWDDAITRLEAALGSERGHGSLLEAWMECALGRTARSADRLTEAAEHLQRALALQQRHAPTSWVAAEALVEMSTLEVRHENLKQASDLVQRALSIRSSTSPNSVGVARDMSQLGWIALMSGDVTNAAQRFATAVPRLEEFEPESTDLAYALDGWGEVQKRFGDFASADSAFRRTLAIYDRSAPEGYGAGSARVRLGNVAFRRRDFENADRLYRRAVGILEKSNPKAANHGLALHAVGDVALARGDLATASRYFDKALSIRKVWGSETLDVAYDLRCLAMTLARQGQLEVAHAHAGRSLEIREHLMSIESYEFSQSLVALGEILLLRGDLDASRKNYERALAIRLRMSPGSDVEAEPLYGIGRIHRMRGRLDAAAEALSRAIEALESQGLRLGGREEARAGFGGAYSRYYREYVEVLLALGWTEDAFRVMERSRARAFLALVAERSQLLAGDIPAELMRQRQANHASYDQIQGELGRLKPGKDDDAILQRHDRLRELREEAASIAARVRESSPRAASLQYPQPLDLSAARAALDSGTALLAYSVGEKESTLFVVQSEAATGDGLSVFTLPVGHDALRLKVESFRQTLEAGKPSESRAGDLYELLVGPAESKITDSKRLVISADGPLHALSFAALLRKGNAKKPQHLAEWKPLHVVASATVYAEIKKGRQELESGPRIALAAFGDPRYSQAKPDAGPTKDLELLRLSERGVTLSPLPSTRGEVQGIAALYPGAKTFLGEEATETRVKEVAQQARYLHIASHAILDEGLPLNSGLALTIPEKPEPGKDNGLLQAWEIFDGPRIDADLVTLSACKTALGKDMGGEGLLGLTRAFQYAGARTVLASLWSVPDRSTAKLMRSFYGHLASGKTKDEALRAAQIELIRSGGPHAHPRHWAAFELFGDWR